MQKFIALRTIVRNPVQNARDPRPPHWFCKSVTPHWFYDGQSLFGIVIQHLDVRRLEPLHVAVVGPDHVVAVDVVGHPGPVHQRGKHAFEIYVVSKDKPTPERCLEETDEEHANHPGDHETPDIRPDTEHQDH